MQLLPSVSERVICMLARSFTAEYASVFSLLDEVMKRIVVMVSKQLFSFSFKVTVEIGYFTFSKNKIIKKLRN